MQYIENIIVPYIETKRNDVGEQTDALVIMDVFRGQITLCIISFFVEHDVHECLLCTKITDLFQPMDAVVNKPEKMPQRKHLGDGTLKKSASNFKAKTLNLLSCNQLIYY